MRIRKVNLATAFFLALALCVSAQGSIPTYTGFTNRNPGYIVQATDWNNEFGNFIAYVNTNIRALLNTVVTGKGNILSGDGTNGQVLTNAGAADNNKVLTLDNTTASGLKWAAVASTALLTTKGDLLGFAANLVRIPVGTNGQVLTADSTNANGVAWKAGAIPSGAILMWSGTYATVPAGFAVCDGANGTPNLQGLFIVGGQGSGAQPPASGGMGYVLGGPAGDSAAGQGQGPAHNHGFNNIVVGVVPGGNLINVPQSTQIVNLTPRYYALVYIMKL